MVPFALNQHQSVELNCFEDEVDRDINAMLFYVQPTPVNDTEDFLNKAEQHRIDIDELDIVEGRDVDAFYDRHGYIRAIHVRSNNVAHFYETK